MNIQAQNKSKRIWILVTGIIFLSLVVACVIAYFLWPKISNISTCTPYRCNTAPIWKTSGCLNENCVYVWAVNINNVTSWLPWNTVYGPCCKGCTGNGCGSGGYRTDSLDYPPFQNGTVCYEPEGCYPQPNIPWWVSWNCQPVFYCTVKRTISYPGRKAFIIGMSASLLGLIFLILCCIMRLKCETV